MGLDLGSMEGGGQQAGGFWPDVYAQTKQSEQDHCHDGEPDLQHTISQDLFTAHLSIDAAEYMSMNVDS
jgi:hypothetical protein